MTMAIGAKKLGAVVGTVRRVSEKKMPEGSKQRLMMDHVIKAECLVKPQAGLWFVFQEGIGGVFETLHGTFDPSILSGGLAKPTLIKRFNRPTRERHEALRDKLLRRDAENGFVRRWVYENGELKEFA